MQKIFDLLEPEKWEVKALGDVAKEIYSGNEVTKAQLGTGDYPAIKCGDINSKLPINFTECISFVDETLIRKKKFFERGDLLIGTLAHKIETLGKATVYWGDKKCIAGAHIVVVKHDENPNFLSYMFSSKWCRKQINKYSIGATVCELHLSTIKKIKIPIPPRHVQDLIVDYLDNWNFQLANLENIVKNLIEIRTKQYNFYFDKLFSRK